MNAKTGEGGESLEEALSNIKKGKIAPCYLLYGEEDFLIQEALQKIIAALLPPAEQGMNLFTMDGEQENIDDICLALLTVPLFPGRKIVAVKNTALFQSKKLLPTLIQRIRDQLNNNPSQAAAAFLQFLKLTGWKIADLQEGGWNRISDAEWQETIAGDKGEDREKWLPKVLELCVARGLEAAPAKDDASGLNRILAQGLPPGNHLILTAQGVDKRKPLFKQISEQGMVLYFPTPKGEARQKVMLLEAAQEFLAERGKRLTPEAWEVLGKKTGFRLRESMLALDMLVAYAGEQSTIKGSDVEEVVGKTKEDTVFDLTATLVEKNLSQSLLILKDLLEQGVHHLVVLKMLTREVRLLLYAKLFVRSGKLANYSPRMDFNRFQASIYPVLKQEKGLETLTAQHPYVIYKLLKNSEKFPYDALVRHLEQLAEMDLALRSTGKDPQLMLERFLTDLCLG